MSNPKIDKNGTQEWHQNGELHRLDGPAVIYLDGNELWYQNGLLHREDGPAVINTNGNQEWHQNGKLHREDGPATIYSDGTEYWFKNDLRHRIDGPAIKLDRKEYYFLYDKEYTKEDYWNHPDVIVYQKLKELL